MLSEQAFVANPLPTIVFSRGASQQLNNHIQSLGLSAALIVTDKNLVEIGHVKTLTNLLDEAGVEFGLFDGVVEDPTDTCLDEGLQAFNAGNFDCVLGFGGGSPMDTATNLANDRFYLDHHLRQVAAAVEQSAEVEIYGLGLQKKHQHRTTVKGFARQGWILAKDE